VRACPNGPETVRQPNTRLEASPRTLFGSMNDDDRYMTQMLKRKSATLQFNDQQKLEFCLLLAAAVD
jgi:hypothetical protein